MLLPKENYEISVQISNKTQRKKGPFSNIVKITSVVTEELSFHAREHDRKNLIRAGIPRIYVQISVSDKSGSIAGDDTPSKKETPISPPPKKISHDCAQECPERPITIRLCL